MVIGPKAAIITVQVVFRLRRCLDSTLEKWGGLKGWMQHWLGVYPPEFEIPTFFVDVD